MDKIAPIYIAGHKGMVGSALMRRLESQGYTNLVSQSSKQLDLRRQACVEEFFLQNQPEAVIICAARAGGIHANNTYRADFIYDNLMIESNLIKAGMESGVKKLIFLGSSCIYPREAPQPIQEEHLLTSRLESTNEPYAVAKIAGIKLCESFYAQYGCNFYSLMPCNLYGINDNFDLKTSHVLPALLRKFHEAKEKGSPSVEIWGSGKPRREFLFVDDLASAIVTCLEEIDASDIYDLGISQLNIGSGTDITIEELALSIKEVTGFEGGISFDASKPDGTMRKLMDASRASQLGISAKTSLKDGLKLTYEWFRKNKKN